jgi:hypothetical protein
MEANLRKKETNEKATKWRSGRWRSIGSGGTVTKFVD